MSKPYHSHWLNVPVFIFIGIIIGFALNNYLQDDGPKVNYVLDRIADRLDLIHQTMEDGLPKNQVTKDIHDTLINEFSRVCFTLGYGQVGSEITGDEIDTPTLMGASTGMKGLIKDRVRRTLDLCVENFPNMFR